MLCPEVWDFKAPESFTEVQRSNFLVNKFTDNIQKFYYSHLISVILPDTLHAPEYLIDALKTDCEYYKIIDLSLKELINKDFIDNFIKKGYFIGLSIDRRIDCDDCICITPDGIIVLSLTKDSFQRLGLDGRVSHFCKNTKSRYIVHVDLLRESLQPNKTNFERIKGSLSRLKNVTLIINWQPHEETTKEGNIVCPSSIAQYFHNLHYEVRTCVPDFQVRTDCNVNVPSFVVGSTSEEEDFLEWLGAYSLQMNFETENADDYLTTYETPEPWMQYGQVKYIQWRGFYSPKQIEKLHQILRNRVRVNRNHWISMYVQGFSDSPITRGLQENHYFTNSDNSYVIVLNCHACVFYYRGCSRKRYAIK